MQGEKNKQRPSFPLMLYQILEDSEKQKTQAIVAWKDNGTSFHIYDPRAFNENILPRYSKKKTKTKFRSFQRQLNIYGFKMAKKSGVYRHKLFRRGDLNSISRIRPRPNGPKKRLNHQDENDDKIESTKFPNVKPPSLVSMDDEGFDFQQGASLISCKTVTTPLVSSIAAERLVSSEIGTGAIDIDKYCIPDAVDSTQVGNEINSAGEDILLDLIGVKNFTSPNDRDENTVTSEQNPNFQAMVEMDFSIPFGINTDSQNLGQGRRVCTIAGRGFDFDLFDDLDLDQIELCSCNGSGCYFKKYHTTRKV